jgi:hypothetical protein
MVALIVLVPTAMVFSSLKAEEGRRKKISRAKSEDASKSDVRSYF